MLLEHLPGKETEDVIDMESFPGLCDRWSVVSPGISARVDANLTNYTTLNQCLIYFTGCF